MPKQKSELIQEINRLRKQKNAVILAHNYQLAEVQDIADFAGDSLELSVMATKVQADVIVFCGVLFMAETAHMLNPEKTTLFPVMEAGCPMADMADSAAIREMRRKHPGAIVVTYVNSTAEAKAESDICVTSANALKIVESIPKDKTIIFAPDRNLGAYVSKKTGRDMILWDGYCPSHMRISPADVKLMRSFFPDAVVMMHPEASPESLEMADEILSTGEMCRFVKSTSAREIIVATEPGIIHRLKKENPKLLYVPLSEQTICPFMKLTTLENILWSLQNMEHKIVLEKNLREKACQSVRKMLEMCQ